MSKILIIEDELDTVKVVTKRLADRGFEVIFANEGYQGIELARKEKPDLIILDLMLPGIDGYRICGLIKKDIRLAKIPILIFTAKAQENEIKMVEEAGADAYLNKPFEPQTLLAKVEELLRKNRNNGEKGQKS